MKLLLGSLAVALGFQICLPDVHTASIIQSQFEQEDRLPFPIPFGESGFIQVWNDRSAGKTLFHEHLDEEHYQFTGGVLMDYKKQYQWTWKYNREQKQVYDCTLARMPNATDPQICLLNHADLHSKGTLGKDYPVDFYREQGQTLTHFVDFWATLQSGSTSLVVAQRGVAKNKITGVSYHQQINIYNLVTTPIDPSVFTVPPSCPSV